MGRPTKLTANIYKAIVDAAGIGVSKTNIAKGAGIDITTLCNWLRWGEASGDPDDIYFQFFQDFTRAEAQVERNHLAVISKAAAKGSWQASGWLLERKFPDQWGRKDRIESKVEVSGSLSSDEERAQRIASILEAAGKRRGEDDGVGNGNGDEV